jgi:hypothetical protein
MGLWFLLGPGSLFMSFFVSLFSSKIYYDLWLLAIVSIFLCWQFAFRGLVVSLTCLVFSAIFHHFLFPSALLWNVGLELTVACGIWVSYLSFALLKEKMASSEKTRKDLFQKISFMEETFKKEEELHFQQLGSLQKEISDLDSLVELQQEQREKLEKKSKHLQETIDKAAACFGEEKKELEAKIYLLREKENQTEIEKKKIEEEALSLRGMQDRLQKGTLEKDQKILSIEKEKKELDSQIQKELQRNVSYEEEKKKLLQEISLIKAEKEKLATAIERERREKSQMEKKISELSLQEETKHLQMQKEKEKGHQSLQDKDLILQETLEEKKKVFDLYKQLKVQFQDKSQTLHKTRKELFHLQEKMIADQREKELALHVDFSTEKEVFSLEEIMSSLEQENKHFQEIIHFLSKNLEKKGTKKREKKVADTELSLPLES